MPSRMPRVGSFLGGALLLAACGSPVETTSSDLELTVDVDVTSDPGKGLPEVVLKRGPTAVATTDAAGHAKVTVSGQEGDVVELTVECPDGHDSPNEPLTVALRRLSTNARSPRFEARCAPQMRTAVVGVRADNGPDLPVMHLGKEIARTDASGAALVVLPVRPNEHVSLVLDTKSAKGPRLRPESPTLTFVAKDRDELVTLDQRFDVERPAPSRRSSAPSGPKPLSGPTKL
jgi:hypothetical protein